MMSAVCRQCGAIGTAPCSIPRCGWRAPILTSVTDEGEVMVTLSSGRLVFMGFWEAVRFAWHAMFKGHDVRVEK